MRCEASRGRGTWLAGDPAFPGGWGAGVYDASDWFQAAGHKWTPETDIVIVVDYAGQYADGLRQQAHFVAC